jgi:hypothetical protein
VQDSTPPRGVGVDNTTPFTLPCAPSHQSEVPGRCRRCVGPHSHGGHLDQPPKYSIRGPETEGTRRCCYAQGAGWRGNHITWYKREIPPPPLARAAPPVFHSNTVTWSHNHTDATLGALRGPYDAKMARGQSPCQSFNVL